MTENPVFSSRQMQMLTAICDTLAPSHPTIEDKTGLFSRKASDLNIPAIMADLLPAIVDAEHLTLLGLTLDLLDRPVVNGIGVGTWKSFLDMDLEARSALLQRWAMSDLPIQRYGFQAFKRIALFLYYSVTDEKGKNPNWEGIGYPGPPPADVAPKAAPKTQHIQPAELTDETSVDVVIIGSGAGGGVVAGELTAAGLSVVVLEKGVYTTHFDGQELASGERHFENRGFLATDDIGMVILAASTLGGGTTINWAASLRTPDSVLKEWETDYGVSGFTGKDYQKSLDAVCTRSHVNTDESAANAQNAALASGAEQLGYAVSVVPRNVKGCEECGFCNFGCMFGAKQSTAATYLQDAYDRGAKIVVSAHADRVIVKNGRAVGVEATIKTVNGAPRKVTIRSKAVVVAAGTLHTPALLLRSGLTNVHIGRNLHLHPTSVTYGIHKAPVYGWQGPIISRYVSQFANLDGEGYGVALETAPIHPGIAAFSLPWADGEGHKKTMSQLDHIANIIIITRDRDGGRVTLDRRGQPVVHYRLSERDGAHLMRGITESLRIHRAASAIELSAPHTKPLVYTDGDFEAYLKGVENAGVQRNTLALFSAHQMSSCRMGGNPTIGAIDPGGESFEVRRLFVADASAFPTATGVNPMITVMGVAHLIAQNIKTKLIK
jgi:choline dehydrogenase-like flavoprotein